MQISCSLNRSSIMCNNGCSTNYCFVLSTGLLIGLSMGFKALQIVSKSFPKSSPAIAGFNLCASGLRGGCS